MSHGVRLSNIDTGKPANCPGASSTLQQEIANATFN